MRRWWTQAGEEALSRGTPTGHRAPGPNVLLPAAPRFLHLPHRGRRVFLLARSRGGMRCYGRRPALHGGATPSSLPAAPLSRLPPTIRRGAAGLLPARCVRGRGALLSGGRGSAWLPGEGPSSSRTAGLSTCRAAPGAQSRRLPSGCPSAGHRPAHAYADTTKRPPTTGRILSGVSIGLGGRLCAADSGQVGGDYAHRGGAIMRG